MGPAASDSGAAPGGMRVVWRLAGATTLMVLAFGMTAPLLAVLIQRAGHGPTTVGAFAMLPFLMIGLMIPLMPRLLARWGVLRAYRCGSALQALASLGYLAGDGLAAWALASAVGGLGVAGVWNATEALLAREAPPGQRGRVMGLYQTALGAAFAVGPFLPGLLSLGPRPLLTIAAALVVVCSLIAFRLPDHSLREPPHGQAGTWQALRAAPALAALAFIGGAFEAGLTSVSAAYAAATGLGLGAAASVAGAIGAGSFLCQYPAGLAADRFRPQTVFTTAAALLLAASLAFAAADRLPWLLWAAGAVWGGVGGALYTLTMVQVAHAFQGRATAGGAAAMITGYTAGGAAGSVLSGAALQWQGALGLSMGLSALALAALVAARRPVPTQGPPH